MVEINHRIVHKKVQEWLEKTYNLDTDESIDKQKWNDLIFSPKMKRIIQDITYQKIEKMVQN